MICSDFFDMLDNYETLDEKQYASLEAHAAECEICREELAFFKSIIKTSASIPCPAPPKTLISDVNAALDREEEKDSLFGRVLGNIRENVRAYATVAACFAVGIAVGLNSGYIKNLLGNNEADGVIKETVVGGSKTESEPKPVPATATEETAPVIEKKSDEKPASSKTSKRTESASATEKPGVSEKPISTSVATSQPTQSKTYVQGPLPIIDDNGKQHKYTIASNKIYTMNNESAQATPVPTPTMNVDNYTVVKSGSQIAYGYYDVPNEVGEDSVSPYILVGNQDMGAVVSTMSELGVSSYKGYYVTSLNNFYTLMDRLDMQGISYACDIENYSDGEISFKLKYE